MTGPVALQPVRALGEVDTRVLVLATRGRDAQVASDLLAKAGMRAAAVASVPALADQLAVGAGAVVVAEEALADADLRALKAWIDAQPPWSDLPFVVLTTRRAVEATAAGLRIIATLGNVSFLERPFQPLSFVATVDSALRSRRRQYVSREHLAQIEQAATALAEADRRKDEFLAMLAHELRNPLAPLTNALRLLARGSDNHEQDEAAVAMAERQTRQLKRLVDDLLEVSRISRGKIELRPEPVLVGSAVHAAAGSVGTMLAERSQRLEIVVPPDPVRIVADPARMAQILENLLTNASKYTPEGGSIRVEIHARTGDVEIRVIDDGIGIAPDMMPRLFELFSQVEATLDRSQGGLGIGLALVRRLAELHGGSVAAYSAGLGKGAVFTVRLPSAPVPSSSQRRDGQRPGLSEPG